MGAPFESLKRGNILDFIAYGFYCCRVEELEPEVTPPCTACGLHGWDLPGDATLLHTAH